MEDINYVPGPLRFGGPVSLLLYIVMVLSGGIHRSSAYFDSIEGFKLLYLIIQQAILQVSLL